MTKKNILTASILVTAILIAGTFAFVNSNLADAAAAPSGDVSRGCQTVCNPFIGSDGTWDAGCFVTCGHPNGT